jgi:uncharacterized protein YndB with AHSA1/START domain
MDPWGTLEMIGDSAVLRFERRLAHPPEKVFRAISDPDELAHWFPATVETELRPGAPIRFEFEQLDVEAPAGEVLEVDPPRLLSYSWGDGVLRWEVVPEGAGCRLLFSHTVGEVGGWGGRLAAARHAAGWDVCLAALEARLDGVAADAGDWLARNEAYVERFGLAEGSVRTAADGHEVRFERDLVQPAADVWAALTGGSDPAADGTVPAPCTGDHAPAGELVEVDPPRLLEYEWLDDGAPAGRVRWELIEHDFGAGLVLTQTFPGRRATLLPAALARWQVALELLVARLHGVERSWPDARADQLEARYGERLRALRAPAAGRAASN